MPQNVKVRSVWELLASRYLDSNVTPHATFNDANATVSYAPEIDPGHVYHLAFARFDNVSDDLRALLIHN